MKKFYEFNSPTILKTNFVDKKKYNKNQVNKIIYSNY